MNPQVLVVGAGPVGLTMAAELARFGISVRIVDKTPARTVLSKALVLWSRTLELLARDGGAEDFIACGRRVTAANIIAGGRSVGHVSTGALTTPFPYALMLRQSETERLLEERLHRHGVDIERQVELVRFEDRVDAVCATLRHADGQEEMLEADWLIGCDGAHSVVRHGLGLTFEGSTTDADWVLADVQLQGLPYPDHEITTFWHRDGVLAVFPISPGRYRVIADVDASGGAETGAPTLERVQQLIDRRGPGGIVAHDPVWLSSFCINERIVDAYRQGRVFVAGDAAHVHSPAGGQGMNTGMQDAFNLAWKLALTCRGVAHPHLLGSYDLERRAIGHLVLRNAARFTEVAMLRNPIAQQLRNLVAHLMIGLPAVRQAMAASMAEVSIGYRDSPLNGPEAPGLQPRPGERLVPKVAVRYPGSGDSPRFVLHADRSAEVDRLMHAFGDLVEPDLRPAVAPDGMWLVRPDGYVAATGYRGELAPVHDYLLGITRPRGQ